ncbi:hypothetical protein AGMMS50267_12420 [Spirochaetia bacterium]|nr:hypothetical protein AGMMS50267_12420 [Spirochaetia bacterium]
MKKFLMLCGALVVIGAASLAADPVEGYWLSVDDKSGKVNAGWEIYLVDGKLFGKILSIADFDQAEKASACTGKYPGFPAAGTVSEMTVVGTTWIFGLSLDRAGAGNWNGGNIIDPNDGKMYGCKITYRRADGKKYARDTLEVRGTIGPFGRSQYWRKSTLEEAGGLR